MQRYPGHRKSYSLKILAIKPYNSKILVTTSLQLYCFHRPGGGGYPTPGSSPSHPSTLNLGVPHLALGIALQEFLLLTFYSQNRKLPCRFQERRTKPRLDMSERETNENNSCCSTIPLRHLR